MIITCPNCETSFDVDASIVTGEERSVQCMVCDHVWVVGAGDGAEPDDAANADAATDEMDAASMSKAVNDLATEARAARAIDGAEDEAEESSAKDTTETQAKDDAEVAADDSDDDQELDDEDTPNSNSTDVVAVPMNAVEFRVIEIDKITDASVKNFYQDGQHVANVAFGTGGANSGLSSISTSDSPSAAQQAANQNGNANPQESAAFDAEPASDSKPKPRRRFLRGILFVITIFAILWLIRYFATPIASAIPALSGLLESYSTQFDIIWQSLVEYYQQLTSSFGGS